jgi:hypothetical protein
MFRAAMGRQSAKTAMGLAAFLVGTLTVSAATASTGATAGRVLVGAVDVLEPFGPGSADRHSSAPNGLVVRLGNQAGAVLGSGRTVDGRYALTNLPVGGVELDVYDQRGAVLLGRVKAPAAAGGLEGDSTPSVATADVDLSPYEIGNSWVVSGTVVPPAHAGQSDLTITAIVRRDAQTVATGSISGGHPGPYRVIATTPGLKRTLAANAPSPPVITVTLSENGTPIDSTTIRATSPDNHYSADLHTTYPIVGTPTTSTTTPTTSTTTTTTSSAGTTFGGRGWVATAANYDRSGRRYVYTCPAHGTVNEIWGTGTYTNDSSVCTAGVHAGVITLTAGGTVTIEIRPGLGSYRSSNRDGISSQSYGRWAASFVVLGKALPGGNDDGYGGNDWSAVATVYRGKNGERYDYMCPPKGSAGYVYGTNLYTDDSSVCTAAVHAGLIALATGGNVTIEIRPGASTYTGSTRNGITSESYDQWGGSYVFVK